MASFDKYMEERFGYLQRLKQAVALEDLQKTNILTVPTREYDLHIRTLDLDTLLEASSRVKQCSTDQEVADAMTALGIGGLVKDYSSFQESLRRDFVRGHRRDPEGPELAKIMQDAALDGVLGFTDNYLCFVFGEGPEFYQQFCADLGAVARQHGLLVADAPKDTKVQGAKGQVFNLEIPLDRSFDEAYLAADFDGHGKGHIYHQIEPKDERDEMLTPVYSIWHGGGHGASRFVSVLAETIKGKYDAHILGKLPPNEIGTVFYKHK